MTVLCYIVIVNMCTLYLSLTGVSIDSSKSNDRLYLTSQRCDSVLQTESSNAARIRCVGGASYKAASHAVRLLHLTLYGHIIQQYGDCYTGRWWVGCYIWYSEEGPGRAGAPSSPFLAVPNVIAHPIHQRPVYQLHIIWCGTIIASGLSGVNAVQI